MKSLLIKVSFVLASLCGCATWSEVGPKAKSNSLARAEVSEVDGEPVDVFLNSRMADVIIGLEISEVSYSEDGRLRLKPKRVSASETEFNLGSAVAISSDGYFLTAAHNVGGGHPVWLVSKSRADPYFGKARVVWTMEKADVALLHIEAQPSQFCMLAEALPQPDSMVILGGHRWGNSAGRVVGITPQETGIDSFIEIEHNAPMVKGDSGGPLIDSQGRLLGINHAWTTDHLWPRYHSTIATAVTDLALRRIIEKDAAQQLIQSEATPL
ncbi:serine protease [Rubellicoccus peritrichatus]|uniref:Serine protease n=1 Tax=Rubellicoccus peritrichatus TaxID=3080537 RepID=A0AAQ3LH46_9BACT|nr:serine protease [Puniceicoccus sp. CR14]WOO43693.1 serine protease [Puniceicoccus sp. CR14]